MGIGQKELTKVLTEVLKAAQARPVLPILDGVLLEVKDGNLSLTCTDLEQYLTVKKFAPGLPEGKIIIKGKEVLNILKTFPAGDIDLEFEAGAVHFKQGRIDSTVKAIGANDEWPIMPELPEPFQFTAPARGLINSIQHVREAVENNDNRPNLSGIFFTDEDGKLTAVSTDTRRLAKYQSEQPIPGGMDFILPIKAAELIPGLFKDEEALAVKLYPEKKREKDEDEPGKKPRNEFAVFDSGEKVLMVRLIEGEFPDYNQVIPDVTGLPLVTLPCKEVTAALKRIERLVTKGKHCVMVSVAKDVLRLSGEIDGTTISETFDVSFPFFDVFADFDPGYLAAGIKAVDGERFVLYLNPDPEKPSVIKPDPTAGEYLYLIMPLRDCRPVVVAEEEKEAIRLEEAEQVRTESEAGIEEPAKEPADEPVEQTAVYA